MVTEGIDITIPTYYDARTYQRSEPHAWSRRAAGVDVQLRVPRGARAKGSSAARGPSNHRPGPGASVPAFRCPLCAFRPAVGGAGEAAPRVTAPGALHHPQRAAADGAARLQPPLPL